MNEKGQYLELTETATALILRGVGDFRREIIEGIKAHKAGETILAEMMEDIICNSAWAFLAPEEIGALTDAPIIGSEVFHDDLGNIETTGNVYWFPDYMIEDPAKILYKAGQIVFTKAD